MRKELVAVLILSLAATATAAGTKPPVTVSPGSVREIAVVDGRCPTFSWGAVPGAAAYELEIYRVAEAGEAVPLRRQRIHGSALSWTPAVGRCLEPGGRYAWSVRALARKSARPSDWSEPSLFRVARGPSRLELEQALDVLRSYLAARDEAAAGADAASEPAGSPGEPAVESEPDAERAAAPVAAVVGTTQLTVDGGVVATSFTGDGSTLTALDPANLAAGTAGIDISGTAAAATALAADPADCPAGEHATGIDAAGVAQCEPAGIDHGLGSGNTSVGTGALAANTTGSGNTAVGDSALLNNTMGSRNTAMGWHAGINVTTESDNILIGVGAYGLPGENGTIRIGGAGWQSQAFVEGIHGVTTGGPALPVLIDASGQLGTASAGGSGADADTLDTLDSTQFLRSDQGDSFTNGTLTLAAGTTLDVDGGLALPGTGISGAGSGSGLDADSLDGLDSSAFLQSVPTHDIGGSNTAVGAGALTANTTGRFNTAVGESALGSNTTNYYNTAIGALALFGNTDGGANTATGASALENNLDGTGNTANGAFALTSNTTGGSNTAVGSSALSDNAGGAENTALGRAALQKNIGGNANTANGYRSLFSNTTGSNNTAVGKTALNANTTGSRNVALGDQAGSNATTGDDNIFIANTGVAADAAKIRIGTQGTQTETYIAGIFGASLDAVQVLVNDQGQLGTASSSRRYKEAIADMGAVSERLLELRPVTFRYRKAFADGKRPLQFGLVAEEVAEVIPELVVFDAEGRPETVKYHLLSTLLLNEVQRQAARIRALERGLDGLPPPKARRADHEDHTRDRGLAIPPRCPVPAGALRSHSFQQ